MRVAIAIALTLFAACKRDDGSKRESSVQAERIAVPGSAKGAVAQPPTTGAIGGGRALTPDEGTLTIDAARGKPGTLVGHVRVAPGAKFHVNVNYPLWLALDAPAGVTLAKQKLVKADAELDEHHLALAVAAVVERPGAYSVTGTFDYAVCDEGSCHQKHQPVAIDFVAQ